MQTTKLLLILIQLLAFGSHQLLAVGGCLPFGCVGREVENWNEYCGKLKKSCETQPITPCGINDEHEARHTCVPIYVHNTPIVDSVWIDVCKRKSSNDCEHYQVTPCVRDAKSRCVPRNPWP